MNFSLRGPLGQALRALTVVLGATVASVSSGHAADFSQVDSYVGISYGVQIRTGCGNADNCSPARDAVKIFGGIRQTPSLATELSYYYLGTQNRTWSTGHPSLTHVVNNQQVVSNIENEDSETHAIGLGVALESEIFSVMTQHLRVGLAYSYESREYTLAGGGKVSDGQGRIFPYFGAGLSYPITATLRVFSSADVLLNPDRTYYVFTVGGGGEF